MKRILYKGQPVVTFRMVDELHERKAGHAKRRFYENIQRFKEGYHYVKTRDVCEDEELEGNTILLTYFNPIGTRNTCLHEEGPQIPTIASGYAVEKIYLTVKGYLLLVKPFSDERSCQVQDALVDDYFRIKEELSSGQPKMSYIQMLNAAKLSATKEIEQVKREYRRKVIIKAHEITAKLRHVIKKYRAENEELKRRISQYEPVDPRYLPIDEAFEKHGQGIKKKVFLYIIKKYKIPVTEREVLKNNKIIRIKDVYAQGLDFKVKLFILGCRPFVPGSGIYEHPLMDKPFILMADHREGLL